MFENNQLVMNNIAEDVLASLIRRQKNYLTEILESIESRDISALDIKETLVLVEKNLRQARTFLKTSMSPQY